MSRHTFAIGDIVEVSIIAPAHGQRASVIWSWSNGRCEHVHCADTYAGAVAFAKHHLPFFGDDFFIRRLRPHEARAPYEYLRNERLMLVRIADGFAMEFRRSGDLPEPDDIALDQFLPMLERIRPFEEFE
jgi:hypothetical protein